MNVCIVKHREIKLTETFIRAHAERLPARTTLICGFPPHLADARPATPALPIRAYQKVRRQFVSEDERSTRAYVRLFSEANADVVLAEYGPTGVGVLDACQRMGMPLIVHFHGYDASMHEVIEQHREGYEHLFQKATAHVAVSRAMKDALVALGEPPDRVRYNPCGVDPELFNESNPAEAPPTFLAVGRLVEKKAPHLLILAFAEVHRRAPAAKLRIVGDGPLYGVCKDLVAGLGLGDAVDFLGPQPHDVVREEMGRSRAFVQHSVVAESGDSEGTPVAVMEAGASALTVITTRHAGIPEVFQEEETGLLVDERDVAGMAEAMLQLAHDPAQAQAMGRAARLRIREHFSMDGSIGTLWTIVQEASGGGRHDA
jgi:colanic acid/amylovoran biosynthesis glycosyltransferase